MAGALDWWREAGVDLAFSDAPVSWIAAEEVAVQPAAPAAQFKAPEVPAVRLGGDRADWPATLEQFGPWWLTESSLDGGQAAGRIPPRGAAGAALLILIEQPEAQDSDSLLSGVDGKLVQAMLAAMGIVPDQAYFASVLPRHMPHPDWAVLAQQGLGEVLLHHLSLAAPQRVIAFGGNILPLLGHDPANKSEILLRFNQEVPQVPVLATRELSALRDRSAWKAAFWRRWLDWTG